MNSGGPDFHRPLFFSTWTIIFHRWVTDVKSNDSENKFKYVLNTSRLLITILLFIGNVELNPWPDSNIFLTSLGILHLCGLYAHANCNRLYTAVPQPLCMFLPITRNYLPYFRIPAPTLPTLPFETSLACLIVKTIKPQKKYFHPRKSPINLSQLGSTRGFKICHLNIRSLVPKID